MLVYVYRIAGNCRGRKLSQFCGYLRKFLCEIWGCGILWRGKCDNPRKFSPRKSYFSPTCESFLPRNFPLYGIFIHHTLPAKKTNTARLVRPLARNTTFTGSHLCYSVSFSRFNVTFLFMYSLPNIIPWCIC